MENGSPKHARPQLINGKGAPAITNTPGWFTQRYVQEDNILEDKFFPSLHILPSIEDEKAFLEYQLLLRQCKIPKLQEAMCVLDIIDAKAQALLAYISISLAAMIFFLGASQNNAVYSLLKPVLITQSSLKIIILILIIFLSIAIIFCLSVVNIVGAHTIKCLKSQGEEKRKNEYEELIIKTTLSRRNRYLIAHRISILTAFILLILFVLILLGEIDGLCGVFS